MDIGNAGFPASGLARLAVSVRQRERVLLFSAPHAHGIRFLGGFVAQVRDPIGRRHAESAATALL